MSSAIILLAFLVAVSFTPNANSQTAKRGVAGAAAALSDWADRQAALNAEIELAKAKAAIELETQRKLQALRAEKPLQGADEAEEVKLGRRHPQWAVILTSSVFTTWLRTRPDWYQKMCVETPKADIMGSCIDDFFGAKIVQVE